MYRLVQDDDCHWAIIPADKLAEFETWLEDELQEDYDWIHWLNRHPSSVVFTDYRIEN